MTPILLLRANASASIGHGHVMRCLALAQSWQASGGRSLFVLNRQAAELQEKLQRQGMKTTLIDAQPGSAEDARQTLSIAASESGQAIIADGYDFDAEYQQLLKTGKIPLLLLDDYGHAQPYSADLVLNQSAWQGNDLYANCSSKTQFLLGAKYALLRQEFLQAAQAGQKMATATGNGPSKILVTTGGVGDAKATKTILQALDKVAADGHSLKLCLALGKDGKRHTSLVEMAQKMPFEVMLHETIADMPGVMNWADVAVTGGGTTLWELAYCGVPAVAVVLSENQRLQVEHLAERDVLINAGRQEELQPEQLSRLLLGLLNNAALRESMSRNGRKLVDGKGAGRVIEVLRQVLVTQAGK